MTYRLPSEHERRAYFAYLKQASSLTAWERVLESHRVFIDVVRTAFEKTQKSPPARGQPYILTGDMGALLRSQSALSKAVDRLRRGDRRCFTWLGAPGHFNEGMRIILAWEENYGRWMHMGGGEFPPSFSPDWPAIEQAMTRCLARYYEITKVLEPRYTDVPAPMQAAEFHSKHPLIRVLLARDLPDVPVVDPPLVITTRSSVPHSGIWEPVAAPFARGLWRRVGSGEYELDGVMNYLHQGSPAPTIAFEGDGLRKEGRKTLWRLLWIDDRYLDGSVPDEEHDYVFTTP